MGHNKAQSLEIYLHPHCEWQEPNHLGHHLLSPMVLISRNLIRSERETRTQAPQYAMQIPAGSQWQSWAFFLFKLFVWKAKWDRDREIERDLPSTVHSPNGHNSKLKFRVWNSISAFHMDSRGPSTWAIHCFPKRITRRLDWKQGTQMWDVGVSKSSVTLCHSTCFYPDLLF